MEIKGLRVHLRRVAERPDDRGFVFVACEEVPEEVAQAAKFMQNQDSIGRYEMFIPADKIRSIPPEAFVPNNQVVLLVDGLGFVNSRPWSGYDREKRKKVEREYDHFHIYASSIKPEVKKG